MPHTINYPDLPGPVHSIIILHVSGSHSSSEHPTTSPTSTGTLTLLAHNVHLVTLLDIRVVVGCQSRDGLGLLDVRTRDQFSFLQSPCVFKQFVLEGVVDVLFDDDVFRVTLKSKKNAGLVSTLLVCTSTPTTRPT